MKRRELTRNVVSVIGVLRVDRILPTYFAYCRTKQ